MRNIDCVGCGAVSVSAITTEPKLAFDGFEGAVDNEGNVKLPSVPFQTEWTSLGTFAVNGDGFHSVYTQQGVVKAYLETGSLPNRAVLVKELLGAKTEDRSTGNMSDAHERSRLVRYGQGSKGTLPGQSTLRRPMGLEVFLCG